MDVSNSIWIAKLLGPVIVALSVPMVLNPRQVQETTARFLADPPLILVSGVLAMVAGLSIVNSHNRWVWGWPLIMTLFGWGLVLGGASRVVAPAAVKEAGDKITSMPKTTRLVGLVWLSLGAVVSFGGYSGSS